MAESENKRTRRTPQERAAEVDEKIATIDESIKELESKKESVGAGQSPGGKEAGDPGA